MDQPDPPASRPPAPASDEPRLRDLAHNPEPKARLFGIPVIYIALVVFIIIIVLLSWFELIGGDLM